MSRETVPRQLLHLVFGGYFVVHLHRLLEPDADAPTR
jgi:hypothetical protein